MRAFTAISMARARNALLHNTAVHAALPPEVSGWAGSMVANPGRWLALLLDGELQGVP